MSQRASREQSKHTNAIKQWNESKSKSNFGRKRALQSSLLHETHIQYALQIWQLKYVVHSLSGQRLMGFGTLDDLRRQETSGEGCEAHSSEPKGWLSGSSDEPGTATASVRFKEVSVKLSQRSTAAWPLPELCSIHTSWGETVSQPGSYSANEGHGVESLVETDVSRPSAQRINAKCGYALSNSTLSTRGSLLLWTNLFISTGTGVKSHAGKDLPSMERLSKHTNRWWGVWFVAVQTKDLIACKASGRFWSHCSSWRFLVRSTSFTVLHKIELRRSHWEFPRGDMELYGL